MLSFLMSLHSLLWAAIPGLVTCKLIQSALLNVSIPPLLLMIGARFISTSVERLNSDVLIYQGLQKFVLTWKVPFIFWLGLPRGSGYGGMGVWNPSAKIVR